MCHTLNLSIVQEVVTELPTLTVEERELVTSTPKWKDIASNHNLYSSSNQHTRNMMAGAMVLGYVTPVRFVCMYVHSPFWVCLMFCVVYIQWNSHGYDVAKIFAGKFTHISPVWLQLLRRCVQCILMFLSLLCILHTCRPGVGLSMAGTHDIDQGCRTISLL